MTAPGPLSRRTPARRVVTHLGSHGLLGLSQVDFKFTDREADVADASLFQIPEGYKQVQAKGMQ